MKLYTEEQVIELCMFFGSYHNYSIEETKQIIEEEQTPIELPSDEEIDTMFYKVEKNVTLYDLGYMDGAKWMKEQILNQNK